MDEALGMLPGWRTSATVVASVFVHAAFLFSFSKAGHPGGTQARGLEEAKVISVEIEEASAAVDPPEKPSPAASDTTGKGLALSASVAPQNQAANAKLSHTTKTPPPIESGNSDPSPDNYAPAADASPSDAVGTGGGPIDLGLGEGAFWPRFERNPGPRASGSADPRASGAPVARPDIGGLRAALAAHDRQLGLGSGGPVVSAARNAAQSSTVEGSATISIKTDATGKVLSVALLNSSSDPQGWLAIARAMAANLRSSTLRIPSTASGVIVTVRLEAQLRLPSGALPGTNGVPHPQGLGLGGEFDVADIGARAMRTVHAQILNEQLL